MVESNVQYQQLWPDRLTSKHLVAIECIAIEVNGDKAKVAAILTYLTKHYPLNEVPISPADQQLIRQKTQVDDCSHVMYGKYKLPENPTNDLVQ